MVILSIVQTKFTSPFEYSRRARSVLILLIFSPFIILCMSVLPCASQPPIVIGVQLSIIVGLQAASLKLPLCVPLPKSAAVPCLESCFCRKQVLFVTVCSICSKSLFALCCECTSFYDHVCLLISQPCPVQCCAFCLATSLLTLCAVYRFCRNVRITSGNVAGCASHSHSYRYLSICVN